MPRLRALDTKASKSSNVPSSGWSARWPPSADPMAQGLPGSSGPGSSDVVPALAETLPDGVDGRDVHDVEAHVGHRRKSFGGADQPAHRSGGTARTRRRRGARSRSTQSGLGSEAARSAGSGSSSRIATSAGSSGPDRRDSAGAWSLRSDWMAVVTRARSARGTRSAASSRRRAPSSSSSSTVCPAASLTDTSCRQVARRSVHPSTMNSWAPISDGSMTASNRSFPSGVHGRRRPLALGAVAAPPADAGGQDVVAVAEDVAGDAHRASDHRLGRVSAGGRRPDARR